MASTNNKKVFQSKLKPRTGSPSKQDLASKRTSMISVREVEGKKAIGLKRPSKIYESATLIPQALQSTNKQLQSLNSQRHNTFGLKRYTEQKEPLTNMEAAKPSPDKNKFKSNLRLQQFSRGFVPKPENEPSPSKNND